MDVTLQPVAAGLPISSSGSTAQKGQAHASVPAVATALPKQASATQPVAQPDTQAATQAISTAKPLGPTDAEVKAAAAKVSQAIALSSPDAMEFATDKATGKSVVRIVDTKTGKLIQQIPSEQMIEIAQSIGNPTGLLLNQKA